MKLRSNFSAEFEIFIRRRESRFSLQYEEKKILKCAFSISPEEIF